jgi:hypothetical protein
MAKKKLEPTVTIGGAPASYKPTSSLQPTVTIGGAPAGYRETITPNFITGEGVPGVKTTPKTTPVPEVVEPVVVEKPLVVTPTVTQDTTQALLLQQQKDAQAAADLRDRQSAYDILYSEFSAYGLGGLVEDVKYLLQSDVSPSQFSLELKNTKSYKDRFAANENRIKAGLRALSPAEYIGLEDQYQEIMRNYGLPASYYTKDGTGKQVGFEKFIAGDVSALELEDRISTAQKRVINTNPEVSKALKQFYPDITNGDILAYTLDPTKGLEDIKRKITAAEIGGAAMIPKDSMGREILTTSEARAMQLAGYGVDKAQATQGYSAIGSGLQRGSELASIYGENPYTQKTAEEEVFKLSGQTEAEKATQEDYRT